MSENGSQADWIKSIHLKYFTAFEDISIEFSPGINFIIGENGTGKTHLLKVMYVIGHTENKHHLELSDYFFSYPLNTWNMVNSSSSSRSAHINIRTGTGRERRVDLRDDGRSESGIGYGHSSGDTGTLWSSNGVSKSSVYIPAKELLSHNKGFIANTEKRFLYFEKSYRDVLINANVSPLRENKDWQKQLKSQIENYIGGDVVESDEIFFIATENGPLEFTLVAEGHRKLALYWLLLNNGMLDEGTILFIDEPEANLNPKLMGFMVDLLLELQRNGVQIFVASHSMVMMQALEQKKQQQDKLLFHLLYRNSDQNNRICHDSESSFLLLQENPIMEAYNDLSDTELKRFADKLR
ncbi:MAG: AAA family ATPase [bacterium]